MMSVFDHQKIETKIGHWCIVEADMVTNGDELTAVIAAVVDTMLHKFVPLLRAFGPWSVEGHRFTQLVFRKIGDVVGELTRRILDATEYFFESSLEARHT